MSTNIMSTEPNHQTNINRTQSPKEYQPKPVPIVCPLPPVFLLHICHATGQSDQNKMGECLILPLRAKITCD